ncbi:hypothetical protein ACLKA7_007882 [Drosophila subpalustris]
MSSLGGTQLKLSKEAKYLGVMLDSNLSWKSNSEERIKKAIQAFYICKKTRIIRWFYTAVVKPMKLLYGGKLFALNFTSEISKRCKDLPAWESKGVLFLPPSSSGRHIGSGSNRRIPTAHDSQERSHAEGAEPAQVGCQRTQNYPTLSRTHSCG